MAKLQAEIKQTKPFASPIDEALLSVLRTAAVLEHHLSEVLKPYGITHTQYNVLRILRGAGSSGLCGREVGERLVSRVPDISRLLDRMEEMQLIEREQDPGDRRHVTARISSKGLRILKQTTPALVTVERARFAGLEPERVKLLIESLAQIRERL
ncbi:MAG TPA: MarR family transcriptional regulator [Gemmatimonadales bacterium]|nr:MarR family transcriptional regulator [Gemmatimonadales bacterium]